MGKYLTCKQTAEILGVAEQTLAQWRYERKGPPFVRISKSCVRYDQLTLQTWLDFNTIKPI